MQLISDAIKESRRAAKRSGPGTESRDRWIVRVLSSGGTERSLDRRARVSYKN